LKQIEASVKTSIAGVC